MAVVNIKFGKTEVTPTWKLYLLTNYHFGKTLDRRFVALLYVMSEL